MNAPSLPRLAMVLGDPAGIGPELIARLLADTEVREKAHIVLIADEAEMRRGMRIAGCEFPTGASTRWKPWISPTPRHCCIPGSARAGTSSHAARRAPSVAATAWRPSRWPSN